jgi:hypothetical protein
MAGGVSVPTTPAVRHYQRAAFTGYTALVCLIAAFGGALFGYDIGERGGRGGRRDERKKKSSRE